MKNLYLIIFILITNLAAAQVGIGKETVDGSAILDFAENTNQGLILPWTNGDIVAETASLVYNTSTQKIEFFDGLNWQDLSAKTGEIDTTEIDSLIEQPGGIVIGTNDANIEGVLILNDPTKALVLPKNPTPWENIKNPEAGTITYDTENKLLCVYNGLEWTFWGL